MINIAKSLRAAHSPDELYLLLAKRNTGSFTYDGIEKGGERVCAEIEEEMRDKKFTKLSIVGYSLGGLVARYAVGLLQAKGILDQVECLVSTAQSQRSKRIADESELYDLCDSPSWSTDAIEGMA